MSADDMNVLSAIGMQAAEMRSRYRLNPAALVTATIPLHVFEHHGEHEVQESATRLRVIVEVREDYGSPPLRTFYPEGYEKL